MANLCVPLVIGLSLVALGCGGTSGENCESPAEHVPASGLFATPESLLYDGCVAGSMANFDANGSWYYEQDNRRIFSGAGPLKTTQSCATGVAVSMATNIDSEDIADSFLDDDFLFWRREREFAGFDLTIVESYVICNQLSDGTYVGRHIRCNVDENGESCQPTGLVLRPFERLAGESIAEGLELISEYRGPENSWDGDFAANVRVHGDYAYVVINSGLRVVDISNLSAPVEVGGLPAREAEGFNDVKVVATADKTYALLASNERGMLVVDVSDPANPREVIAVTPSGEPAQGIHTIFTEEVGGKTMAYLADGVSNVVSFWDVSDPATPVRTGGFESDNTDWAVHDLFAEDGRLYLNATVGGMLLVDSQPDSLVAELAARFEPARVTYSHSNWVTEVAGRKVSLHGDEGYDAKFKVVDVDPDSSEFMTEIGRYQTRPQVSAHNVMAFGDRGYAAYYQDGIRVLDLSDPTAPSLAAYYNTWEPATSPGGRFEGAVGLDVDPERGLIFVADYPRGLLILKEL